MSSNPSVKPSLLCIFFACVFLMMCPYNYIEAQNSDRVIRLPGQPWSPPISQFAGYITVNQKNGRALFYWFFEALYDPAKRPLVLWLNGGPGCSSIGGGATGEIGPLRVLVNGTGLSFNPDTWTQEANLLFIESPVGVGFSYTNTSSDLENLNDSFVAEDTYNFLVSWFARYPQYKSRDFYISGESYAGHYVPQLAELIHERNNLGSRDSFINLKGFILGNPVMNDEYDNKGIVEFAWSHAVISDKLYQDIKRVCNFESSNWSDACKAAMTMLYEAYNDIDIYNIYGPKCLINSTFRNFARGANSLVKTKNNWFKQMPISGGSDPCFPIYAEKYFNRIDVQLSLHATPRNNGKWSICSESIFATYNYTVFSMLPTYTKLIKAGVRIWVYSGDTDGVIPVIGTRYSVEALNLPIKSEWRSWFYNRQVGGRTMEYEGLTLATVRGAGHMVPISKPEEALTLFRSFLNGQDLPSRP